MGENKKPWRGPLEIAEEIAAERNHVHQPHLVYSVRPITDETEKEGTAKRLLRALGWPEVSKPALTEASPPT
jgi:hypothetical protein